MRYARIPLNASRVIIVIFSIYVIFLIYTYNQKLCQIREQRKDISYLNFKEIKYILQWTRRYSAPFDFLEQGNSVFVKNKCKYTNCFVTDDSNYFVNLSDFDAVIFNGRDVINNWPFRFPSKRFSKQKYIFGAMESPDNFPACDEVLDGVFNWTWTYKLDSDFRWGYITIYDLNGNAVGPAIDMKWPELSPISEALKVKLSNKYKAAAWLVSHCNTKSERENYVDELQKELAGYGWSVDVYGKCGTLKCSESGKNTCFEKIEDDYYFYLSFENSFAEDYVTEKLHTALVNYAVPIVYGAANYSRFLPPGSYLDARELGVKELARQMSEIIGNSTRYHDFFRWHNHYQYKLTSDKEDMCTLCQMLNNEEKVREFSVWNDFRTWWNGERYKVNCS